MIGVTWDLEKNQEALVTSELSVEGADNPLHGLNPKYIYVQTIIKDGNACF